MASGVRITLALMGDTMLGRLVDQVLHQPGVRATYPWGDTLQTIASADSRILNLETALTRNGQRWQRTPKVFHFKSDPVVAIPTLQAAGIDLVCLANNHVLDFEETGGKDTITALDDAGIGHAGFGHNLHAAQVPAIHDAEVTTPSGARTRIRIALLSMTDNEPGWKAGFDSPGTNYLLPDPRSSSEAMAWICTAVMKARADGAQLVILGAHWGGNWIMRPSDLIKAFAHACVDAGVDILFGHSPHVTQGVEVYKDRPIIYAAGDWIDDYAVDDKWHNDWGALFKVHFDLRGDAAGGQPEQASATTQLQFHAVEMIPVKLSFAQTNLCRPGHPEHAPLTSRLARLCGELGSMVELERDGHLWCRANGSSHKIH